MNSGIVVGLSFLFLLCSANVVLAFTAPGTKSYVGAKRCQPCHQREYDIWAKSGHALSQSHLDKDKQKELRCLFCHATDVQENLGAFRIANVQCEACHGPGAMHVRQATQVRSTKATPKGLQPVTEALCRQCHSDARSPSLRPFDFQKSKRAIIHW